MLVHASTRVEIVPAISENDEHFSLFNKKCKIPTLAVPPNYCIGDICQMLNFLDVFMKFLWKDPSYHFFVEACFRGLTICRQNDLWCFGKELTKWHFILKSSLNHCHVSVSQFIVFRSLQFLKLWIWNLVWFSFTFPPFYIIKQRFQI